MSLRQNYAPKLGASWPVHTGHYQPAQSLVSFPIQGSHILWLYAGQALWLEQLCRSRIVRPHFQKVLRTEKKFLVKVQFRTILSSGRDLSTAILTAAVSHYVILIGLFFNGHFGEGLLWVALFFVGTIHTRELSVGYDLNRASIQLLSL